MKVTLDLPDDLAREVKLRAVMLGTTMRDLVADVLRRGLHLERPEAPEEIPENSLLRMGGNGLPEIRCRPSAPAGRMTVEELLKLDQQSQAQEDLKRGGFPA